MPPDGPVGAQTLAELERLNAVETVEGQIALRLAAQLDAPRTGMAVAQDAKELRVVLDLVRDRSSVKESSPVDDLIARRAARESAAKAV